MRDVCVLPLCVFVIGCWVMNAIKLTDCDFEADYKCEVAHAIGLIGPSVALVTVWAGTDEF